MGHGQARRRPARARRRGQALLPARVQALRPQDADGRALPRREALRRPLQQALLQRPRRLHHLGPVVAMVWEGKDAVKTGRKLIGATNPLASEPGTIRGDFCIDIGRNVIHGSDAVESANHEIGLWFPEGVCEYAATMNPWIYE